LKLAIIGSRSIEKLDLDEYIKEKPDTVISGGAKGIDTIAWEWAIKNNIEIIVHRPDYNKDGKKAALRRNDIIVDEADKIIAFWNGKSTGTKYVIDRAEKLGKPLEIVLVEEKPVRPITSQERLVLISAFFGFSRSNLSEIFGVTRQVLHNWFNGEETEQKHYEKIKLLADIAFEIAPNPSHRISQVYINKIIPGYDKSLLEYLLDDSFNKETVINLSRKIYEMSKIDTNSNFTANIKGLVGIFTANVLKLSSFQ
jgi:hypothetical protein